MRAAAKQVREAMRRLPRAQALATPKELGLADAPLPLKALRAAADILQRSARGEDAEVMVLPAELSAQQAADLVGVSRPHLNMLLGRERIPYRTTSGGHRRIRRDVLLDYKRRRETAHTAMREAVAADRDLAYDGE